MPLYPPPGSGGGGAVDSVAGKTGHVTLVTADITDIDADEVPFDPTGLQVVTASNTGDAVRDLDGASVTPVDTTTHDVDLSTPGEVAIDHFPDSIPNTELHVSATDRLLGRDTAAAGAAEELTVGGGIEFTGSGGIRTSAFTGDVTKAAGSVATTVTALRNRNLNSGAPTYGEGYVYDGTEFVPSGLSRVILSDNGVVLADVNTNQSCLGATVSVPAAALVLGASIMIEYDFAIANTTGGNVTLEVEARLGAVDYSSITTGNIATATITAISGTIYLMVGTAGASGIIRGKHTMFVAGNLAPAVSQSLVVGGPSGTVDLSGALTLDLRGTKSTNNAAYDVTCRIATATYFPPA